MAAAATATAPKTAVANCSKHYFCYCSRSQHLAAANAPQTKTTAAAAFKLAAAVLATTTKELAATGVPAKLQQKRTARLS